MAFVSTKSVVLLDLRGLILKSYFGAEKTIQERGRMYATWQAGLLRFTTNYLLPILDSTAPKDIIAVKDSGNEYRTSLYASYKSVRKEKSRSDNKEFPGQAEQLDKLFKSADTMLKFLGVKLVDVKGQEADDVIALLVDRLPVDKTVYTIDADLLQLAGESCDVVLSGELYTQGSTHKGVPVDLIVLYKSLVGDSSDEYKGVPGFGEASWKSCLTEFGVDGMEQLESCVKGQDYSALESACAASNNKHLLKISRHTSEWRLSYLLATLNPEICYGTRKRGVQKPVWTVGIPDTDRVREVCDEINAPDIFDLLKRHLPTFTLVTSDNHEVLRKVVDTFGLQEVIAYDFESYDCNNFENYQKADKRGHFVDTLSQRITGLSFCTGDNFQDNYYVSIDHDNTNNLSTEWAAWLIQAFYSGRNKPIVHNAAFELTVAKQHLGLTTPAPYDTSILQSYVDENEETGLKAMTKRRFHYQQESYQDVTQGTPMNRLPASRVVSYGCDDSLVTAFHFDLQRIIAQLEGSWDFYDNNEVDFVLDTVDTFIEGTPIDIDRLSELSAEDKALLDQQTREVRVSLEKNCAVKSQGQQTRDAQNLLGVWWELAAAKLQSDGASSEEMAAKRQELWEKAWHESVYTPYTEEIKSSPFVPTANKINAVFSSLDSDLTVDKVSKRYFTEWFVNNEDKIDSSDHDTKKFVALMAAAIEQFPSKKRTGKDYEAFSSYASSLLARGGEVVKVSDGDELNFGSSNQMTSFLYGKLGLPVRSRSKVQRGSIRDTLGIQGSASTGNMAIAAALVFDVTEGSDWRLPVLHSYRKIVAARQNASLYYTPYPMWVRPTDGRIHPQIRNCGTVTRRPSGTAPNVLQVSAKDGAKIRSVYTPPEGMAYVCLDFNGQELRITASESRDPAMLEAYIGGDRKDLHSLTGSSFAHTILIREGLTQFSRPLTYAEFVAGLTGDHAKSIKKVRGLAKTVNFGLIYGMSHTSLAQSLLIPDEVAKSMMENTFRLYSRLQHWQREVADKARGLGYIETAYGNRKHVSSDLYSDDGFLRSRQERQVVNYTVQGCAADILKVVLRSMWERKIKKNYKLIGLKPVYDEIAACVPISAIPDYIEEMKEIMEITPPGHSVPMSIEASIGVNSWGDKVELGRPEYVDTKNFISELSGAAA